jgi:iron complex outermembrane receptor protein
VLRVPVKRALIAGSAHFEAADFADLFAEARFANTRTKARFGSVFEIPPTTNQISINNPYVSSSLRALMQQNGVTSIGILRSDQELGLRGQDAERNLYQLVGGSRGSLGFGNFKYEAAIQYGSTQFTNTRVNDVDQAKFQSAIDVFRDTDGVIKCSSAAARAAGCVPINLLQPGAAISPAAVSYIRIPFATETAHLSQFDTSLNVTGSLGDFWGAGAISVAGGVEYRREKSVYLVSPVDAAGQGFFFTKRQSTSGSFDVFEYYAEAVVPVLKNLPFVKSLEIEGAIRRSDYSTSGRTTSWKAGGTYAPISDIRFRAIVARAVRAPNVGELYSPGSEGFNTVDDPCDVNFVGGGSGNRTTNCRALGVPANYISNARTINIRTSTSGNANLKVEKADTLTIGTVLTPRFLPNFSATIDFYKIRIKDAINVFSSQDILNNCVDLGSIANPFCASITRSASGDITQIVRQNINVSRLDRKGVDTEIRYRQSLGRYGALSFDLVASRAITVSTVVAPGTLTGSNTIDFNGEFGYPKWKGRFSTVWQYDRLDVTGTLLYQSNTVRDKQPTNAEDNRASAGTGDYFLINSQIGIAVTPKVRGYIGADNLADKQPPSLPDTRMGGASSYAGAEAFPITGRYFYVGFSAKF